MLRVSLSLKYLSLQFNNGRQTFWIGIGASQGCVLHPILITLYTHDCTPRHQDSPTVKNAEDTSISGRIVNHGKGRRLGHWVERASHVQRLCPRGSGPGFQSWPGALCCVSLPLSLILFPVMSSAVLS